LAPVEHSVTTKEESCDYKTEEEKDPDILIKAEEYCGKKKVMKMVQNGECKEVPQDGNVVATTGKFSLALNNCCVV